MPNILNPFAVVGGWANNRTLIRRKRQDHDMTVEYNFNVLRRDDPLKMLIEISNGECVAAAAKHIFLYHIFICSVVCKIKEVAFIVMRYLIKLLLLW